MILFNTDAYKLFHRQMYPENTTTVTSNWTPRSAKHYKGNNKEGVIVFGIQAMIMKLVENFQLDFFSQDLDTVLLEYGRQIRTFTGDQDYSLDHIKYLHDLGYLPLLIKALPEGTLCPIGVPCMTITNTDPECFWLTNYLETYISAELWGSMTSATIANEYREILTKWAEKTGDVGFVQFQGHDFSMRGMFGVEAAVKSGLAHLTSFAGSDTIPAYLAAQKFYGQPLNSETSLTATSVPATEHSVQCSHYNGGDELEYLDHILDTFPTGIVSIVCDGFDFWKFITETLPKRKERIMSRNGKIVVRPDSGDPVDIICGRKIHSDFWYAKNNNGLYVDDDGEIREAYSNGSKIVTGNTDVKGAIQCLYEIFGGTTNEKGFIELDPHIGLIYGDSITLDRAEQICQRLAAKNFASTNVVLGIGSYTYQFNTRDTFGFAIKATHIVLKEEQGLVGKDIYKAPKTGDGTKKSAKGLVRVEKENGTYKLYDQQTPEQFAQGELKPVFLDGVLNVQTLDEIRARIKG